MLKFLLHLNLKRWRMRFRLFGVSGTLTIICVSLFSTCYLTGRLNAQELYFTSRIRSLAPESIYFKIWRADGSDLELVTEIKLRTNVLVGVRAFNYNPFDRKLYWSENSGIFRVDTDGQNVEYLGLALANSIKFRDEYLIFSGLVDRSIDPNIHQVGILNLETDELKAIDVANEPITDVLVDFDPFLEGSLVRVDERNLEISRVDTNGTQTLLGTLPETSGRSLIHSDLVLDPLESRIYWNTPDYLLWDSETELTTSFDSGGVYRSSLVGSDKTGVVPGPIRSFTIDFEDETIYLAEDVIRDTSEEYFEGTAFYSSGLDGTDRRFLFEADLGFVQHMVFVPSVPQDHDCNIDGVISVADADCISAEDLADLLDTADLLLGDLDGNGSVGFEDFLTLSQNFGSMGTYTEGDLDLNGIVEFSDFLAFSNSFGQTSSGVQAVPEPAVFTWWPIAFLVLNCTRRRKLDSNQAGNSLKRS